MAGTRIYIFARSELVNEIQDIRASNKSTGVAGVGYNKGSAGVSIRMRDVGFTFIASHFAAHQVCVHFSKNATTCSKLTANFIIFGGEFCRNKCKTEMQTLLLPLGTLSWARCAFSFRLNLQQLVIFI
jgi:hypothetical protein